MHAFVGKNKTKIHFNSDMSGECIIHNENGNNIKISCEDIIDFVAEYVRMEKISRLEQMSSEEILGLKE